MHSSLLRLVPALALAVVLAYAAPLQAQQATFSSGSAPPEAPPSPVIIDQAPEAQYAGGEIIITHSLSQEIVPVGVGVMCPTPPTSIIRVFDLGAFGLEDEFQVTSVDIGIREVSEASAGATDVRLYTLDGDLLFENMTLVAEAVLEVSAADAVVIRNVEIDATFEVGAVVVLEWHQPQNNIFFGGNTKGQTGPVYLWSPPCGADEPIEIGELAPDFADHMWVANIRGQVVISTEEGPQTRQVALGQSYPNPATASATIPVTLAESGHVRLAVYDALGREVAVLADQPMTAGAHEFSLDTASLASGLYYVRAVAGSETIARQLTVVR